MRISDWSSDVCSSDLTDATLTMFDKLLGSMTRRAENRTRDKAVRTVREMQGHLRALTNSCRVLIDAHAKGIVSLASIGPFDWERFGSAVAQAEVDRKSTRLNSSH